MNHAEIEATRIFISGLVFDRDIRRKFNQLREDLSPEQLTGIISELLGKRIIDEEEQTYLLRRLRLDH